MKLNKQLQVLFLATVTVFSTGLGYTVSAAIQENPPTTLTGEYSHAEAAPANVTLVTMAAADLFAPANAVCIAPTVGTCQAPCAQQS